MFTNAEAGASHNREYLTQLLEVARRYYLDGENQATIAAAIGYSRVTVSRLLAQARDLGIVRIEIGHQLEYLMELETRLAQRFQLQEVRIAASASTPSEDEIGAVAAELLISKCTQRSTVAISNGRAVASVVEAMPRRHWSTSCVVPMLGLSGKGSSLVDSPLLCRRLARNLGGSHWVLPVPLVFETSSAAQAMLQEVQVTRLLELARRADVALTGVGAVGEKGVSPILRPWITKSILKEICAKGGIAHIGGHFIDVKGKHIETSLCARTVCLEPKYLRSIPFVLGVAYGPAKVAALQAVLRGKYLDALVTDENTAQALLQKS